MLIEITDESVDLFTRGLAETHSRARRDLQTFRQQQAVAINEKVMLLQQIGQVILDPAVADLQVRPEIFAQVPREQLQQAVADCPVLIRPVQDEAYDKPISSPNPLGQRCVAKSVKCWESGNQGNNGSKYSQCNLIVN